MGAESVLYIRGPFPFNLGHSIASEIVLHLKVLLATDDVQLGAIAHELEAFPGFLDRRTLELIIGRHGLDGDHARAIAQLILSTDKLLREADVTQEQLLSGIEASARSDTNRQVGGWSDEDLSRIFPRLQIIMRHYSGLALQAKAQRLSEATGTQVEKLEVICDLRPIFDENRERVQGVIPFTILKVVCKGVDGLPVSFEAMLSSREVDELATKMNAAKHKLERLRELLAAINLPIPNLDTTLKGGQD
jgi:hypothetical protein